jgi:hypothetical protein
MTGERVGDPVECVKGHRFPLPAHGSVEACPECGEKRLDWAGDRPDAVTLVCGQCGATRRVGAGEIAPDEFPMCERCGLPLERVGAEREQEWTLLRIPPPRSGPEWNVVSDQEHIAKFAADPRHEVVVVVPKAEPRGDFKCPTCVGMGEIESSDSGDESWWDCRRCGGTGRLAERRSLDPRLAAAERAREEAERGRAELRRQLDAVESERDQRAVERDHYIARLAAAESRNAGLEEALDLARRTIPCPHCEGPDTDCFACLGCGNTILCARCDGQGNTGAGEGVSACPECGGSGVDETEIARQVESSALTRSSSPTSEEGSDDIEPSLRTDPTAGGQ